MASTLVFKPQLFTLFIESRNNDVLLLSRIASRTVWPDDKITFSRDQFLRSLSQMGVPLSIDHERQLTDMLRSNNNQEIDFILLSELVGMKF